MTTDSALLFVVLPLWILIGITAAIVMRRRGHSLFSWGLLGAVFGPLVVVFALDAVRREGEATPATVHTGAPGRGPVDVLVGIDGSPESEAALDAAIALLDGRIGRLVLATVVDYDAADSGMPREYIDGAKAKLEAHASVGVVPAPGMVLLPGRADEALPRYARREGFDVIVVGARGAGGSRAVLGSVAEALARGTGIPVLLGGGASTPVSGTAREPATATR